MEDEKDLEKSNEEAETSENEQEETEAVEEETEETVEETDNIPSLEDYYALEKKNKELYERAKKAEARAKISKRDEAKKEADNKDYLTREEAVLLAKGYDEEDIKRLGIIATAEGKKMNEVVNDEMFTAWKEKKDKKAKSNDAQLISSKTRARNTKPVSEMSEEEHRKFFNEHNK